MRAFLLNETKSHSNIQLLSRHKTEFSDTFLIGSSIMPTPANIMSGLAGLICAVFEVFGPRHLVSLSM